MSEAPPIGLADIYRMMADGVLTITPALDVRGDGAEPPRKVLEAVIEHKPLILYHLARELAWEELQTWRWGPALAEDPEAPPEGDPAMDAYAIAEREAIQKEAD